MVDEPLDDVEWIAHCVAQMVALDPMLDPVLAQPVAQDMSTRQRWRTMTPDAAAQAVFDFGKKHRAAGV